VKQFARLVLFPLLSRIHYIFLTIQFRGYGIIILHTLLRFFNFTLSNPVDYDAHDSPRRGSNGGDLVHLKGRRVVLLPRLIFSSKQKGKI
jgi:hypothetical protein